jgi:hypothetical protein
VRGLLFYIIILNFGISAKSDKGLKVKAPVLKDEGGLDVS